MEGEFIMHRTASIYCFFSSGQSVVHSLRMRGPSSLHDEYEGASLASELHFAFAARASVPAVDAGMKVEMDGVITMQRATKLETQGNHMGGKVGLDRL